MEKKDNTFCTQNIQLCFRRTNKDYPSRAEFCNKRPLELYRNITVIISTYIFS